MLINRKQVLRIVVIAYFLLVAPPTPDVISGSGYAAASVGLITFQIVLADIYVASKLGF